jgi:two-component system LytT family response regulator
VFLDVRMPQHDGFELLRSLHGRGVHPLVVFVTAFSEHAVTAFDEEAIDYVLKPFDDARLTRALARAKAEIFKVRAGGPRGGDSRPPPRVRDRLMVTDNGRTLLLPIRDIEFLQAAGKRVKIFAQGSCYLLRRPLRELEASLDPNQFVRVHRSTLVNVEQILEMHALFHGDFEIVLKRGTRIPMSRRFRDRMLPFTLGRWPS